MKDFKTIWKQYHKEATAEDYVALAIFKAMKSKRNMSKEDIVHACLQRTFSPITNKNKLTNGMSKWNALERTLANMNFRAKYAHMFSSFITNVLETAEEWKEFFELLKSIRIEKLGRKYIYYFTVQNGLSPEQQGVQAGHALFALGHELGKTTIDPHQIYFQWIGVNTEAQLVEIAEKHSSHKHVKFYEPDHGNLLTSVAFHPVLWNDREEFRDYPLLTH